MSYLTDAALLKRADRILGRINIEFKKTEKNEPYAHIDFIDGDWSKLMSACAQAIALKKSIKERTQYNQLQGIA